jgi:hypothetical protein
MFRQLSVALGAPRAANHGPKGLAMCEIAFHAAPSLLQEIPHPYPASQQIPTWYKEMPMNWAEGGTLKRCPPYFTAMAAGYIIPVPHDTRLHVSENYEFFQSGKVNIFEGHFKEQFAGAPFSGLRVLKFENPWIIVTPPEFVCLVTAPINRFDMPFIPLTGIIETGTYYKEVRMPVACTLGPGQSYVLRRGSPMIQVIPIRREAWTMKAGVLDQALNDEQQDQFDANPHAYKDEFWKKLHFT